MRFMVWFAKPKRCLGKLYQLFARKGIKIQAPQAAMRQLWSDRGTTGAVALSVENGDAPLMNWRGVGARDFPLRTKGWKLDGAEVDKLHHQEALVRRLPGAVQGHRRGQEPRPRRTCAGPTTRRSSASAPRS